MMQEMAVDLHNPQTSDRPVHLSVDEAVLKSYSGPIPRHIAVIMDGNGRWAKTRNMGRIRGHHAGADAVRSVVESCRYLGVEVLTLYAFSEQNWSRPEDEVSGLMALFDLYIKRERSRLIDNNVRIQVIGDRERLGPKLQESIANLEAATAGGARMTLQVAVSYGGREEIARAAQTLATAAVAGRIKPEDITPALFERCLYTAGQPDPDLVIRTSGELRISNFLLWQLAYSEIYVTETLWPDFNEHHLMNALKSFGGRERRFGLTGDQLTAAEAT
jgi:undecaprenyl diphosphate synthase